MSIDPMRFLLVEDHAFQRRALGRMLADLGAAEVIEATGGRAALDILRDTGRRLDVIVADLDMPDMDGMEFLRHIGERGAPTGVVLASALDPSVLESTGRMARAYGVNLVGSLVKPLAREALVSLRERYVPPADADGIGGEPAERFSRGDPVVALRRRQFVPVFQPMVEARSGRIICAEALARSQHPRPGLPGPGHFVPVMEAGGLIDDLTWTLLEQAAQSCRDWRERGLHAGVSVNLSAASPGDPQAASRVAGIVAEAGLDPCHTVFELTEFAATTDMPRSLETIDRLRMKGFEVAVDDCGTGYSSMQRLARIPFTKLEIDRSFADGAADNARLRAIVERSIRMASDLGVTSVAEGVEKRTDREFLAHAGYDAVQGYFVERPIEGAAMLRWSGEWVAPAAEAA